MFDFLNNVTHKHTKPTPTEQQQLNNSSEFNHLESNKLEKSLLNISSTSQTSQKQLPVIHQKPKKKKQERSIVAEMQKGDQAALNDVTMGLLQNILKISEQTESNKNALNIIKDLKLKKEKKVYFRQMSNDQGQYLQVINAQTKISNNYLKMEIADTVNGIINQITDEIITDKADYEIKKKVQNQIAQKFLTKQELQAMQNGNYLLLIKLKEGELKQKIGQLKMELIEENVNEKALQIVDKSSFSSSHIKTKLAEEYVKNKQQEREQRERKKQEYQQRKRVISLKKLQQEQLSEINSKEERHKQLVEHFKEKQKLKKEEEEKVKAEKEQFQQFLNSYRKDKPLFMKKQEEFQEVLKSQKRERYHKLEKQRARYESLDMDDLDNHQEKYLQLKQEERERKEAEIELTREQLKLRKKELEQKMYKGKYRYLVLKEMVDSEAIKKQKQREKQQILMRKHAYSVQVKQNYKPKIDPAKRQEMQELLNRGKKKKYRGSNRVVYGQNYESINQSQHDAYSDNGLQSLKQEGKKQFRLFKQYIRSKIEKGQVKPDSDDQSVATLEPQPNYLKELRQKNKNKTIFASQRFAQEISSIKENDDLSVLRLKAEQFDIKAKRRQLKLKHADHKPQQQAQLQDEYLCAIKAKLQLINNFD